MTLIVASQDVFRDLVRQFFHTPDDRAIGANPARTAGGGFQVTVRTGTASADPFRMAALRYLIASPHTVRLMGVAGTGVIPDQLRWERGRLDRRVSGVTLNDTSRSPLDAGGVTLPGRWIAGPGSAYSGITSATNVTFAIYRVTPVAGGARDASSLPHELFGHTYLLLRSAPWDHGASLGPGDGVPTPFARLNFTGPVDDFLAHLVAHEENITCHVGTAEAAAALATFRTHFERLPTPINNGALSRDTELHNAWRTLGYNVVVMHACDATCGSTLAAGLITQIVSWYRRLPPTRRADFGGFVRRFRLDPQPPEDVFGSRANALADELSRRLPA